MAVVVVVVVDVVVVDVVVVVMAVVVVGKFPNALTSCRLSTPLLQCIPLSIWTITYLPFDDWPGDVYLFYKNLEFYLRLLYVVLQCQVQGRCPARNRQRTFGLPRLEDLQRRAPQHF